MIIGITGHRPPRLGCGYNIPNPTYDKIYKAIMDKFHELNPEKIITGMAQGTDQIAAWVAMELNVPYIAALPCDDMDRIWPEESKRKFKLLLNSAEEVINVNPGPYAGWKMHKRDEYVVDNSDLMLAVYDGKPVGGTFITVDYANKSNKKVVIINPKEI